MTAVCVDEPPKRLVRASVPMHESIPDGVGQATTQWGISFVVSTPVLLLWLLSCILSIPATAYGLQAV